jgi:chemotaxis protein CheX
MNVKFLNPFVEAAFEVLKAETNISLERGDLILEKTPYITEDVTVVIALVGRVEGTVFYSMSQSTAISLASRIMGESLDSLDALAQSGIAELGNVITGRASVKLSQAGYESTISPPTLLLGKGATISTVDFQRLVVPLRGECGVVDIHLALRDGLRANVTTAQLKVPRAPIA